MKNKGDILSIKGDSASYKGLRTSDFIDNR